MIKSHIGSDVLCYKALYSKLPGSVAMLVAEMLAALLTSECRQRGRATVYGIPAQ